jgi:hypothetical protein
MHPDQVRNLDALLVDHLHRYADDLKRRVEEAYHTSGHVMRAADNGVDFDLDAWMRESEPPIDDVMRQQFGDAIAALLEDA